MVFNSYQFREEDAVIRGDEYYEHASVINLVLGCSPSSPSLRRRSITCTATLGQIIPDLG